MRPLCVAGPVGSATIERLSAQDAETFQFSLAELLVEAADFDQRRLSAISGRTRQVPTAVVRWRLSLEKTPLAVMTIGRSLPRPQAASSSLRFAERSRSASVNFYRQM